LSNADFHVFSKWKVRAATLSVDVFSAETLISGVNPEAAQVALAAAFLNKEKARFREHPQPVATLDPI
jgi:hypothetical protein